MARWKKPSRQETVALRRELATIARAGELRVPFAVGQIRRAVGLNQEEFAKLLRMTRRQIAEIESGKANPTLDTLERIGRLFGFTIGFVPVSAPPEPSTPAGSPSDPQAPGS